MNRKSIEVAVAVTLIITIGIMALGPSSAKSTRLEPSAAVNLASFDLSEEERGKLHENGFIVIPEEYKKIYQVYKDARQDNIPIFVTTDVVLHTAHLLFDYTLRLVELEHLKDQLTNLTRAMVSATEEQQTAAQNAEVKKAAKRNIAFFAVASKLLAAIEAPDLVKDVVDQELALIEAHEGIALSPLFDYEVDYSQYLPRGHYTRNEEFERYFKAMIWYGKMMFRLKPGESPEAMERGRQETLSALLIVDALKTGRIMFHDWQRIYDTTAFFVGEADNLQANDYNDLLVQIYGEISSIDEFADPAKLDQFIIEAFNLPKQPKILPIWAAEEQVPLELSQGFCFLGQRFIPDSYMFQQLVYDKVGTIDNARIFPKGLDVMAILGSGEAEEVLREEGEFDYKNYGEQLNKLKEEFAPKIEQEWTQNLYWHWFYSLRPLLEDSSAGPFFTQNKAWLRKELNTALGSWTELRHDTVLYAKPSVTVPRAFVEQTKGYVEPYPKVYQRVADLTEKMREDLASQEILDEVMEEKLTAFAALTLKLKDISEKELQGKILTEQEYQTIWNTGNALEGIVELPEPIRGQMISGEDERMALVVDVHTDPQMGMVLEEAVGNAFQILALVEVENEVKVAEGGVFSYYEFTQPISERLTDWEWHEMLETGKEPPLPQWTESFRSRPNSVPAGPLAFETLDSGLYSGITEHKEVAVRSHAEWADLWREHISIVSPPPDSPTVDFSQEMVVAVFMGEQSTGGYSIEINQIVKEGSKIKVFYTETSPDPECMVAQMLTQPFHIVKLARQDLPLVFIQERTTKSC